VRRRANFPVAVTVVVLLVALTFTASLLRPLVPTPAANPIANYSGDYLKQAASQEIEWHPCDETAFSEARRLDRPVLLFIGVAWSQAAREMDQDVLSSSDVENYLSHHFVCVRIDGNEMPAWISAFLPLTRVALGIRPRFQIWALQPDGKLIENINRRLPATRLGQSSLLKDLVRVHDFYTDLRQQGATGEMENDQRVDLSAIESLSPAALDYAAMATATRAAADTRNGGFPLNGFQDLRPFAWEFLLKTGDTKLMHDTLMPVLRSPAVDLLDGGFFQTARSLDRRLMEFDKSAVANAEMARLLSQARVALRDPNDLALCDYALRSTLNSLTGEFRSSSGFINTARIGDENEIGRSARSSITPERMRNALDADTREWARVHLGLRVESNPQMIPFLVSSASLAKVDDVREKFAAQASEPKFTTNVFMDINATVAACLMEVGRATQNAELINIGSDLFERLELQRVGDTVPHDLQVASRTPSTLQDYLAFSDAALQDYLTTGRVPSLQNGLAVLRRGLQIFAGPVPGEFRVGLPPGSDLLPKAVATPQVVDDLGESASSKVVRLCASYGRLYISSGDESDIGVGLLRIAYATQGLMARPLTAVGITAASFACASLALADDQYAIGVGPDAQKLADELYRARPTRFIAAAVGPVRTDLANKTPGVYVVKQGLPLGPFTVEQAKAMLPWTLSSGQ
jgi:uncharacterized protein YyaL (SSP411 family)